MARYLEGKEADLQEVGRRVVKIRETLAAAQAKLGEARKSVRKNIRTLEKDQVAFRNWILMDTGEVDAKGEEILP